MDSADTSFLGFDADELIGDNMSRQSPESKIVDAGLPADADDEDASNRSLRKRRTVPMSYSKLVKCGVLFDTPGASKAASFALFLSSDDTNHAGPSHQTPKPSSANQPCRLTPPSTDVAAPPSQQPKIAEPQQPQVPPSSSQAPKRSQNVARTSHPPPESQLWYLPTPKEPIIAYLARARLIAAYRELILARHRAAHRPHPPPPLEGLQLADAIAAAMDAADDSLNQKLLESETAFRQFVNQEKSNTATSTANSSRDVSVDEPRASKDNVKNVEIEHDKTIEFTSRTGAGKAVDSDKNGKSRDNSGSSSRRHLHRKASENNSNDESIALATANNPPSKATISALTNIHAAKHVQVPKSSGSKLKIKWKAIKDKAGPKPTVDALPADYNDTEAMTLLETITTSVKPKPMAKAKAQPITRALPGLKKKPGFNRTSRADLFSKNKTLSIRSKASSQRMGRQKNCVTGKVRKRPGRPADRDVPLADDRKQSSTSRVRPITMPGTSQMELLSPGVGGNSEGIGADLDVITSLVGQSSCGGSKINTDEMGLSNIPGGKATSPNGPFAKRPRSKPRSASTVKTTTTSNRKSREPNRRGSVDSQSPGKATTQAKSDFSFTRDALKQLLGEIIVESGSGHGATGVSLPPAGGEVPMTAVDWDRELNRALDGCQISPMNQEVPVTGDAVSRQPIVPLEAYSSPGAAGNESSLRRSLSATGYSTSQKDSGQSLPSPERANNINNHSTDRSPVILMSPDRNAAYLRSLSTGAEQQQRQVRQIKATYASRDLKCQLENVTVVSGRSSMFTDDPCSPIDAVNLPVGNEMSGDNIDVERVSGSEFDSDIDVCALDDDDVGSVRRVERFDRQGTEGWSKERVFVPTENGPIDADREVAKGARPVLLEGQQASSSVRIMQECGGGHAIVDSSKSMNDNAAVEPLVIKMPATNHAATEPTPQVAGGIKIDKLKMKFKRIAHPDNLTLTTQPSPQTDNQLGEVAPEMNTETWEINVPSRKLLRSKPLPAAKHCHVQTMAKKLTQRARRHLHSRKTHVTNSIEPEENTVLCVEHGSTAIEQHGVTEESGLKRRESAESCRMSSRLKRTPAKYSDSNFVDNSPLAVKQLKTPNPVPLQDAKTSVHKPAPLSVDLPVTVAQNRTTGSPTSNFQRAQRSLEASKQRLFRRLEGNMDEAEQGENEAQGPTVCTHALLESSSVEIIEDCCIAHPELETNNRLPTEHATKDKEEQIAKSALDQCLMDMLNDIDLNVKNIDDTQTLNKGSPLLGSQVDEQNQFETDGNGEAVGRIKRAQEKISEPCPGTVSKFISADPRPAKEFDILGLRCSHTEFALRPVTTHEKLLQQNDGHLFALEPEANGCQEHAGIDQKEDLLDSPRQQTKKPANSEDENIDSLLLGEMINGFSSAKKSAETSKQPRSSMPEESSRQPVRSLQNEEDGVPARDLLDAPSDTPAPEVSHRPSSPTTSNLDPAKDSKRDSTHSVEPDEEDELEPISPELARKALPSGVQPGLVGMKNGILVSRPLAQRRRSLDDGASTCSGSEVSVRSSSRRQSKTGGGNETINKSDVTPGTTPAPDSIVAQILSRYGSTTPAVKPAAKPLRKKLVEGPRTQAQKAKMAARIQKGLPPIHHRSLIHGMQASLAQIKAVNLAAARRARILARQAGEPLDDTAPPLLPQHVQRDPYAIDYDSPAPPPAVIVPPHHQQNSYFGFKKRAATWSNQDRNQATGGDSDDSDYDPSAAEVRNRRRTTRGDRRRPARKVVRRTSDRSSDRMTDNGYGDNKSAERRSVRKRKSTFGNKSIAELVGDDADEDDDDDDFDSDDFENSTGKYEPRFSRSTAKKSQSSNGDDGIDGYIALGESLLDAKLAELDVGGAQRKLHHQRKRTWSRHGDADDSGSTATVHRQKSPELSPPEQRNINETSPSQRPCYEPDHGVNQLGANSLSPGGSFVPQVHRMSQEEALASVSPPQKAPTPGRTRVSCHEPGRLERTSGDEMAAGSLHGTAGPHAQNNLHNGEYCAASNNETSPTVKSPAEMPHKPKLLIKARPMPLSVKRRHILQMNQSKKSAVAVKPSAETPETQPEPPQRPSSPIVNVDEDDGNDIQTNEANHIPVQPTESLPLVNTSARSPTKAGSQKKLTTEQPCGEECGAGRCFGCGTTSAPMLYRYCVLRLCESCRHPFDSWLRDPDAVDSKTCEAGGNCPISKEDCEICWSKSMVELVNKFVKVVEIEDDSSPHKSPVKTPASKAIALKPSSQSGPRVKNVCRRTHAPGTTNLPQACFPLKPSPKKRVYTSIELSALPRKEKRKLSLSDDGEDSKIEDIQAKQNSESPAKAARQPIRMISPSVKADDLKNQYFKPKKILSRARAESKPNPVSDVDGNAGYVVSDDPGEWPDNISKQQLAAIVARGPIQVRGIEFPFRTCPNGRRTRFTEFYYTLILPNGKEKPRPWLVYGQNTDKVYCFCCRLFGNEPAPIAQGANGWRHMSRTLIKHEATGDHLECETKWAQQQGPGVPVVEMSEPEAADVNIDGETSDEPSQQGEHRMAKSPVKLARGPSRVVPTAKAELVKSSNHYFKPKKIVRRAKSKVKPKPTEVVPPADEEDGAGYALSDDPGQWPACISKAQLADIVARGPVQVRGIDFPATMLSNRKQAFKESYYTATLRNGDVKPREWLVYGQTTHLAYCFCCKLFGNETSKMGRGNNNWHLVHHLIKRHEEMTEHIECETKWKLRREGKQCLVVNKVPEVDTTDDQASDADDADTTSPAPIIGDKAATKSRGAKRRPLRRVLPRAKADIQVGPTPTQLFKPKKLLDRARAKRGIPTSVPPTLGPNICLSDDPSQWPDTVSQDQRVDIVQRGPVQVRNIDFPFNKSNTPKRFSSGYYNLTLPNGSVKPRPWLVYGQEADKIYCFSCKLFGDPLATFAKGTNNWEKLERRLKQHDEDPTHLKCETKWSDLQAESEATTWKRRRMSEVKETSHDNHSEYQPSTSTETSHSDFDDEDTAVSDGEVGDDGRKDKRDKDCNQLESDEEEAPTQTNSPSAASTSATSSPAKKSQQPTLASKIAEWQRLYPWCQPVYSSNSESASLEGVICSVCRKALDTIPQERLAQLPIGNVKSPRKFMNQVEATPYTCHLFKHEFGPPGNLSYKKYRNPILINELRAAKGPEPGINVPKETPHRLLVEELKAQGLWDDKQPAPALPENYTLEDLNKQLSSISEMMTDFSSIPPPRPQQVAALGLDVSDGEEDEDSADATAANTCGNLFQHFSV